MIRYSKTLVVAQDTGVNVPATGSNIPPVPADLVHVPPGCSPVIKENKSIVAKLLSQIVVEPSIPALGCRLILIVAILVSFGHGFEPTTVYVKVLVVAPLFGVNTPAAELKVPPVPLVLVQTPPKSSPVINENKLIDAVLVSQIVVEPSVPASGC